MGVVPMATMLCNFEALGPEITGGFDLTRPIPRKSRKLWLPRTQPKRLRTGSVGPRLGLGWVLALFWLISWSILGYIFGSGICRGTRPRKPNPTRWTRLGG